MKRMRIPMIIAGIILVSCAVTPPGQVQNETGYHPASGKIHMPPGQAKKHTK